LTFADYCLFCRGPLTTSRLQDGSEVRTTATELTKTVNLHQQSKFGMEFLIHQKTKMVVLITVLPIFLKGDTKCCNICSDMSNPQPLTIVFIFSLQLASKR